MPNQQQDERALSLSLSLSVSFTHTHTHTRTHARARALTHTRARASARSLRTHAHTHARTSIHTCILTRVCRLRFVQDAICCSNCIFCFCFVLFCFLFLFCFVFWGFFVCLFVFFWRGGGVFVQKGRICALLSVLYYDALFKTNKQASKQACSSVGPYA